ncbi:MAG: (2Fe-2S)-binding protein [Deltaproteobacteria bacterium]|jgi:bacterioferritin-associated ferredoxin|nr:(2Fe-2S)-binding protein [Deltaproteobacteria bacterium]
MAPAFIFAEQVLSIVRSGKKEIEIPEGACISSAAADLIKEHQIQIKTVAPGLAASGETSASKANRKKQPGPSAEKPKSDPQFENSAEITEEELEEIVDRIIKRFKQLKGGEAEKEDSKKSDTAVKKKDESTDTDDLVICRCEEITRGEIKDAIRNGIQTLNGIKRITRAGMGLCQGQTCQQLVARILTEELGLAAADIDPTTARGPVRPLRLEVFANS